MKVLCLEEANFLSSSELLVKSERLGLLEPDLFREEAFFGGGLLEDPEGGDLRFMLSGNFLAGGTPASLSDSGSMTVSSVSVGMKLLETAKQKYRGV